MAISCSLNKNMKRTDICGYSLKQIVSIYLGNFDEVSKEGVLTIDPSGYEVTTFTAGESQVKWYQVDPAKDTAAYNDDLVVGGNGSKYRTHVLNLSVNGAYNKETAAFLDTLSLGKFVACLKLSDGSAIMLGRLSGLEATAASSLSEAAADGQNGMNFTLEGNTVEPAIAVSTEALTAIETSVPKE